MMMLFKPSYRTQLILFLLVALGGFIVGIWRQSSSYHILGSDADLLAYSLWSGEVFLYDPVTDTHMPTAAHTNRTYLKAYRNFDFSAYGIITYKAVSGADENVYTLDVLTDGASPERIIDLDADEVLSSLSNRPDGGNPVDLCGDITSEHPRGADGRPYFNLWPPCAPRESTFTVYSPGRRLALRRELFWPSPSVSPSGYVIFCTISRYHNPPKIEWTLSIFDGKNVTEVVQGGEIWAQWRGGERTVCTSG